MPELPEVETIKLGLQRKIVGLEIKKIQVFSPKSFIGTPELVEGKIVLKVWRRAKLLGLDLGKITLLFHLKMTGQVIWQGKSAKGKGKRFTSGAKRPKEDAEGRFIGGHPTADMVGPLPNKHTRVIFDFSDGSHLYFNDQRRFGWIKISEKGKVISDKSLQNLGPEPLEAGFTWQVLKSNLLNHKSQPIKVALMDQKIVSGIGNIYASEACFNAGLDPRKKIGELSGTEFKSLHRGVLKALRDGIRHGGSTRAHFVDSEGRKGYFLDYAFVYGKDKHKCKVCGSLIEKIQLTGRGTYFCETCQK